MVIKVDGKEYGDLIKITNPSLNITSHKTLEPMTLGVICFSVMCAKGECKVVVYLWEHYIKMCVL